MLQCRQGKRSPAAAVRIAVDLAEAGIITRAEAISRVSAEHVESLLKSVQVDEEHDTDGVWATGLGASPGVASGHVARDLDEATTLTEQGKEVILVRKFTAPDDVPAMFQSVGVLTEVGGATSHAALVCREIGLPCVVGAGEGLVEKLAGRVITIDGTTGKVHAEGSVNTSSVTGNHYVRTLIEYASACDAADHPIRRLDAVTG